MSTRARFFCENCHTEVRATDKVCPACGRFFGAVRCPRCSFTAEAELFREGCPSCGYLGGEGQDNGRETTDSGDNESASVTRLPLEAIDPDAGPRTSGLGFSGSNRLAGSLDSSKGRHRALFPLWFYRVSIAILTVLLVMLAIWFTTPG